MSVLDGPREEWRRILHEGHPQWVKPAGDKLILGDGRVVPEASATYLPPCDPTKILCIHLNYESRRVEFRAPMLETPTYFQKPTTALNSHRGSLCRPAGHKFLNYEGEVGVIIGKPMRNVGREQAWYYIAGFAPANDVGCQDYRETDAGSMLRVKGQDGFCPIGPGIVSGVDIRTSTLRTYIDGKVVQDGPRWRDAGHVRRDQTRAPRAAASLPCAVATADGAAAGAVPRTGCDLAAGLAAANVPSANGRRASTASPALA